MSKFIDMLDKSSQAVPQPIGFRTKQAAQPEHRIQLVATIKKSATGTLTDYVTGADAILLQGARPGSGAGTLKKTIAATPDIPWGIQLEETVPEELRKAVEAGFDFIVFPAGAALAVPPDDSVGMIIQVDTSIAEGPLRTVNDLPVDAVLVTPQPEKDGRFTWHQLMLLRRFAGIVTTPLLVSIPSGAGADELQFLQEAGIDAVVVDTGPDQPPGEVSRLRQVIDSLKPPTTRRRQKMDALLPPTGPDVETVAEIEEEEDRDD